MGSAYHPLISWGLEVPAPHAASVLRQLLQLRPDGLSLSALRATGESKTTWRWAVQLGAGVLMKIDGEGCLAKIEVYE